MAWAFALRATKEPTVIVLTRQKLEPLRHADGSDPKRVLRGAYVLDGYAEGDITIIATGSEVPLAVKTADLLRGEGTIARVVSAPSLDLFDGQPADYQDSILGDRSRVVCIEAGRSDGWASTSIATRSSSASIASARPRRTSASPRSLDSRRRKWRRRFAPGGDETKRRGPVDCRSVVLRVCDEESCERR